jgi:hypothetical protein
VTFAGAVQPYVPALVNTASALATKVLTCVLKLDVLDPYILVAYTDRLYRVSGVNPNINMDPTDAADALMLVVPVVATAV